MSATQRIHSYRLHIGGQDIAAAWRAVIHLLDKDGSGIAKVFFVEGNGIPDDVEETSEGLAHMFLAMEHYSAVVDLLRHEKPAFFTFTSSRGLIYTGKEPIGEGELSSSRLPKRAQRSS